MRNVVKKAVPKEDLQDPKTAADILNILIQGLKDQLVRYLLDELSKGNELICRLNSYSLDNMPIYNSVEITSCLVTEKLIRCCNCEYRDKIDGYCNKLKYFVPTDFYCKNGISSAKMEVQK